jgi:hypothetical protein
VSVFLRVGQYKSCWGLPGYTVDHIMSQSNPSRGLASYFDDENTDDKPRVRKVGLDSVDRDLDLDIAGGGGGDLDDDLDLDADELGDHELGGKSKAEKKASAAERALLGMTKEQYAEFCSRRGNDKVIADREALGRYKQAHPSYAAPPPAVHPGRAPAAAAAGPPRVRTAPVAGTRRFNAHWATHYRNVMAAHYANTDAIVKRTIWNAKGYLATLADLKKLGKTEHTNMTKASNELQKETDAAGRVTMVKLKGFDKRDYVHEGLIQLDFETLADIHKKINIYAKSKGMQKVLTWSHPLQNTTETTCSFITVYMDWIFAEKRLLMNAVAAGARGQIDQDSQDFIRESTAGEMARREFEKYRALLRVKKASAPGVVAKPRVAYQDEAQRDQQRAQFRQDRGEVGTSSFAGHDELRVFGE